jgi:photosystem II stability/assembly factor-like uncharacterized protein
MKQIFIFVLGYFFFSQSITATEIFPAMEAPLAEKSLLLDITVVDQSSLVAVGERGHILISTDAITWQQANVPIQSTLTSIYFETPQLGWAVGHDSSILKSENGGRTWQIQQYLPESQKPLLDIVFYDENNGIAIGAYGQFYRTINGGENWVFEFHPEFLLQDDIDYLEELKLEDEEAYLDERGSILPHFNRLLKDGRTLYMVGEIGLIAKSNDFGKTWLVFDEIYSGSFLDIRRTSQGNLLVAGLRGNVFRSIDNGVSWQHVNTNTTALFNSIVLSEDKKIYLLGNNGTLLQSNDDGQSFFSRNQPDGKAIISGVWFKNKIIAVSDVGIKMINVTTAGLFE